MALLFFRETRWLRWQGYLQKQAWTRGTGKPQNLGFPVNNARDQVSPALHPDGKTLYFASSGHGGMGGLDVVKSVIDENGRFSTPVNLGPPVNTPGNDYFFAIPTEGDKIFFASSRSGGYGGTDLYTYPLDAEMRPSVVASLQGRVVESGTQSPIDAVVRVEDLGNGQILFDQATNPETGEFLVVLPAGRSYGISVSSEGYVFTSTSIDVSPEGGYMLIDKLFELSRVQKGTKVVLNNLFFYFGKAELKPESYPELDRVVEILNKYPDMSIAIKGYTDTIGTDTFNLWLSEARSQSVYEYLIKKLIPAGRMTYKGYGKVISGNLQESRRVEFEITGVSAPDIKKPEKAKPSDDAKKDVGKDIVPSNDSKDGTNIQPEQKEEPPKQKPKIPGSAFDEQTIPVERTETGGLKEAPLEVIPKNVILPQEIDSVENNSQPEGN